MTFYSYGNNKLSTKLSLIAAFAIKQVGMTMKCHNHRTQTNPWHLEEVIQNTDKYNTIKLKHLALSSLAK